MLSSKELDTWWEHFDFMITSITDPDALAEAASEANLIHPDVKEMVLHGCFADVQAKTRSLLQIIEGKVKGQPYFFHHFLAVLRSLPRLSLLVSHLLSSYGRFVVAQFFQYSLPKALHVITDEKVTGKSSLNNQQSDSYCKEDSFIGEADSDESCDDDECEASSHMDEDDQQDEEQGFNLLAGPSFTDVDDSLLGKTLHETDDIDNNFFPLCVSDCI